MPPGVVIKKELKPRLYRFVDGDFLGTDDSTGELRRFPSTPGGWASRSRSEHSGLPPGDEIDRSQAKGTGWPFATDNRITDPWFVSGESLPAIASRIGLSDVTTDCEDHWERVIGTLPGHQIQLDITRSHQVSASELSVQVLFPH